MRRRQLAGRNLGVGITAAALLAGGCGPSGASPALSGSRAAPSPTGTSASSTSTAISTAPTAGAGRPPVSQIPARRRGPLAVTPTRGRASTVFRFGFRAPAASGRHGHLDHVYVLSASVLNAGGGRAAGCVATHAATMSALRRGQAVSVALGPLQLRGDWCPGAYTAQVTEELRPVCAADQLCPQFIAVAAVLGPVRFTVTR